MNKEKYTSLEVSVLLFILLNSFTSTILINLFKGYNTLEIIISILISLFIGLLLHNIIIRKYNSNIFENISKNKIIKFILLTILGINVGIIALYSINYTSAIVKDILLPNQNIYIITFSILLTCAYLSLKGLKSITISSNLLFLIGIIIFITSVLFNTGNISIINLLPINTSIDSFNFIEIFIYTNAPIFLTLMIPKNLFINFEEYKSKSRKTYILFYIYLIIKIIIILSVLGIKYMDIIKYPEIEYLKTISIFNFFERLEEILILNIFIENFILISLSMCYILNILNSFKKNKYNIAIIVAILFLVLFNVNNLNNSILFISNIIFIITNLLFVKNK